MTKGQEIDRRTFLELAALAAAALPLGCSTDPTGPDPTPVGGRLAVTWAPPSTRLGPGEHALGLGGARDGYIRVPDAYRHDVPAPMALLLHGAGRDAHEWIGGFPVFEALGLIVLSVDSRDVSWDIFGGGFGEDVLFVDRALRRTFEGCNVDPHRVGIAGFSDGASYALSLGLTNGDLFTHILGFSPGDLVTDGTRGTPPVFLSHGSGDRTLPVAFTRELVETLRAAGHIVRYEEFDGGHMLPYAVGELGFGWFVHGEGTMSDRP